MQNTPQWKTNAPPNPIKYHSEALPFFWAAASGQCHHHAPCPQIGSLAAGGLSSCALGLRVGQTLTVRDVSWIAPASAPPGVAARGDPSPLAVPAAASGLWLPTPPRPPVLPRGHCHLCVVKTNVPLAGLDSKGAASHCQDKVQTLDPLAWSLELSPSAPCWSPMPRSACSTPRPSPRSTFQLCYITCSLLSVPLFPLDPLPLCQLPWTRPPPHLPASGRSDSIPLV